VIRVTTCIFKRPKMRYLAGKKPKLPEYYEIEHDPGNGPLWIVLIVGLLLVAGVAWLNFHATPGQIATHQQITAPQHRA